MQCVYQGYMQPGIAVTDQTYFLILSQYTDILAPQCQASCGTATRIPVMKSLVPLGWGVDWDPPTLKAGVLTAWP